MDVIEREIKMPVNEDGKCPFEEWYRQLKDIEVRAIVRARIARLAAGNFGDWKAAGNVI